MITQYDRKVAKARAQELWGGCIVTEESEPWSMRSLKQDLTVCVARDAVAPLSQDMEIRLDKALILIRRCMAYTQMNKTTKKIMKYLQGRGWTNGKIMLKVVLEEVSPEVLPDWTLFITLPVKSLRDTPRIPGWFVFNVSRAFGYHGINDTGIIYPPGDLTERKTVSAVWDSAGFWNIFRPSVSYLYNALIVDGSPPPRLQRLIVSFPLLEDEKLVAQQPILDIEVCRKCGVVARWGRTREETKRINGDYEAMMWTEPMSKHLAGYSMFHSQAWMSLVMTVFHGSCGCLQNAEGDVLVDGECICSVGREGSDEYMQQIRFAEVSPYNESAVELSSSPPATIVDHKHEAIMSVAATEDDMMV